MALEIERKFLLRSDEWRSQVTSRMLMRQGYLASGSRSSIRVRIADSLAWLNLKAKRSGMTRVEYEYPIPVSDVSWPVDEVAAVADPARAQSTRDSLAVTVSPPVIARSRCPR